MEVTFSMDSNWHMKSFKGLTNKERVNGLIKIKTKEMIEAVLGMVGEQFQEWAVKRRTNLDVISIFIAWGLELNNDTHVVERVIQVLFDDDLLGTLSLILEWSIPSMR